MKVVMFFISLVLGSVATAQTINLPSNLEPGKCYVKCYKETKKKTKWKEIHCALVNFQILDITGDTSAQELSKKDKTTIDKTLVPLMKKGYHINLRSHYVSENSKAINIEKSTERAVLIGNYLIENGMNRDLLTVNSLGDTAYNKTAIEYRIINAFEEIE